MALCALAPAIVAWHITSLAAEKPLVMPPVTRPTSSTTTAVDPTIETQVFWMKYRMPIIAGVVALLIAGIAYGAYYLYTTRRDDAAAAQLAQAKGLPDYEKVINDYSGAPAAASAALMMAAEQRKTQKFADANATLQKFISAHPKHELVTTAQMSMAANLESLGKPDEALEMYRRVAAEHPRDFNAPLALLAQVPLLKAKGQIDQARQVCEIVLTQYRDSEASSEATRYLRSLKPATTAAPQPAASVPPARSAAPTP
ncbi:MAG: tetratricopeptide repeat protein [Chthoniobacterales bacterium]